MDKKRYIKAGGGVTVAVALDKMTTCKTCSKEVAKSANNCPHCGAKLKMGIFEKVLIFIGVLFVMTIIYAFLASPVVFK